MKLPDLSNMMYVGQMRYIQAHYESAEYRNPDLAVGEFLSLGQRLASFIQGRILITKLRRNPFYFYVLARTKYYDKIFLDGVYGTAANIINIGCGSDTRAYRYAHILNQKGVAVFECDQESAINNKQKIALKKWPADHVRYMPIDLNKSNWPNLSHLLDITNREPALVILEGVSPYVEGKSFEAFLRLLSTKLHKDSVVAYDSKIFGVFDSFGKVNGIQQPFRLPADETKVNIFHDKLGFKVQNFELSSSLSLRMLPGLKTLFEEDCLLLLKPN